MGTIMVGGIPLVNVAQVPPESIDATWDVLRSYVAAALEKGQGEIDAEYVFMQLLERHMQLWVVLEGAMLLGCAVTEVVEYPRKRICRIVLLAGKDVESWLQEGFFAVAAWAKTESCDTLEAYGRKGWLKLAEPFGFRHAFTVISKEL